MRGNAGATSLKRRRRMTNTMQAFDALPAELRTWLATAVLPWSPHSVRRAYRRALARTADKRSAILELDRIEQRQISRDARKVWGNDHPYATQDQNQ